MGFFDISLDTANEFYAWGWRASVAGALITSFGVGFLFWGTRVRDRDFDANIATLHDKAATAEKQSKILEKEAATARLETEKLKAVVAWRTLSESQGAAFKKAAEEKPGSVNLRWQDGDPEAMSLAIQISNILGAAQWNVAPGSFKPANSILFGVVLPPVAGVHADTLREALRAARLAFSSVPISGQGASFNVSTIPDAPFLYIGSRMPVTP